GNEDQNIVQIGALTGALPDKSPPTFNGATAVASTSPTSIDVTWNSAADDVSRSAGDFTYLVYVSATTPVPTKTPALTVRGALGATVVGLAANTNYNVVVIAQDAAGNSSTSPPSMSGKTMAAVVGDTTAPAMPDLPNVLLVVSPATQLDVNWTAATDAPN